MSAIANYFKSNGKNVAGYDKVSKPLTDDLINEDINIHFSDNILNIPEDDILVFQKKEPILS